LGAVLADSEKLTTGIAIHSDIRRTRLGYVLYGAVTALLFRRSFVREDGLISIRRSFLPSELREVLPSRWRVRSQPFFRTLAIFDSRGSFAAAAVSDEARRAPWRR
jgi:hypothetical protein